MLKLFNFLSYFTRYNAKTVFLIKHQQFFSRLLDIFWDLGLIFGYKKVFNNPFSYLAVYPKIESGLGVIKKIKILTRPSYKSNFITFRGLSKLLTRCNGLSVYLVSTCLGLFEAKAALKLKVGGELFCKIYF